MTPARIWRNVIVAATVAIALVGISSSAVLAEKNRGDTPSGKTCLDKLHAAGLACSRGHRACIAENTTDAQLYCDTEKEICESRAKNAHRACEKAMVGGQQSTTGVGQTPRVLDPGSGGSKGGDPVPGLYSPLLQEGVQLWLAP